MVLLLICILPAMGFTWRFACQSLAPRQYSTGATNPYAAPASDIRKTKSRSVVSPSTALLWQFLKQNKRVYLSLFAACLVVGLIYIAVNDGSDDHVAFDWAPFVAMLVSVSSSWMGVLVFQSDSLQDRIRFLADRGVSPYEAWLVRMVWPLLFVSVMVWLYALYFRVETARPYNDRPPSAVIAAAVLLLFFIYGQWFAQLIKQPLLSALGAPVVGCLAMFFFVYSYVQWNSPLWSLSLVPSMPLIATGTMMRRWMDRALGWTYYASHVGFIALSGLVPIAWLMVGTAMTPGMDADMRRILESEAKYQADYGTPQFVSLMPSLPKEIAEAEQRNEEVPDAERINSYPTYESQVKTLQSTLNAWTEAFKFSLIISSAHWLKQNSRGWRFGTARMTQPSNRIIDGW